MDSWNVIEMYGCGRFNGLGLVRPTAPAAGTPGAAPPPPGVPTASAEDLTKQASQRWASIAAANEATAAGATAKEVDASRTAVYLAKGVQIDAERAGLSKGATDAAVVKAFEAGKLVADVQWTQQEAFDAALKAGASIEQATAYAAKVVADAKARAAAALKDAQTEAQGSSTIYYVAGGLVLVGILGTIVLSRRPAPRPALAGINRRRKRRSSWIR